MAQRLERYNVFFRETRRHKWHWLYEESRWATTNGLQDLRENLRERLDKLPREQGKTPGYAIVQDASGIVLMFMSKATYRRIPRNKKTIVERRETCLVS